jgi:hypothetical protein
MDIRRALTIITTASLLWGIGSAPKATAQTPSGSHLEILSSDDRGIVLELMVSDFQIETGEHADQTYHQLVIPGTAQTDTAGEPQVPTRGALLGLPHLTDVSVQILEADYETLRGYRLPPGPGMEIATDSLDALSSGDFQLTFTPNQELYATDAFYPGHPVKLGETGYLRDQAVAQVQFYPVQYNPVTGEVRLYRRIRARVTCDTSLSLAAAKRQEASPVFEHVLRDVILNYDTLERPPVPDGVPSSSTTPPPPYPLLPPPYLTSASSSTDTLKIGVAEDGLYQLTYSDLVNAGFDLSGIDPHTIKISNRGAEIPIYVAGEDDGTFESGDTILFYGTAITDVYTLENVYWLTVGESSGQRMDTQDGTPVGATVPVHFPNTLHAEEDTYYWQVMPNGTGQDHWFWDGRLTAPASRDYSLTLNNVSTTAAAATLRVRLKGGTDTSTIPDHHTRIHLNGVEIDDQYWDGQIVYDHEVTVDHSLLDDGNNTIRVESPGDTGATVDQIFVNWIEIEYWDTYVAENDELFFGAPMSGTFQFEVTGFSTDDVQVFDVTDPTNVTVITGTVVSADGGSYKLEFEDAAQSATRYLALTSAQRKSPVRIEPDQPSAWHDTENGADYIIITHEDFYTSSLRLASHRAITSGLRVATVKVEDVYDEFNYGIFNPQAIRDFLSYAYHNWIPPAPTYVLLVGDACQDYKDNANTGTINYVPSQIIETDELGETPSDNWFVSLTGTDILPDMSIGRLSAQEASQVDDIVDKIIDYEQHPPAAPWNTQVLLVADDGDSRDGYTYAFEDISEQLSLRLPYRYTANKIEVRYYPPGNPTNDISNSINPGNVLVNYAGHGNVDRWGLWSEGTIFTRSDVAALTNNGRLPMVTTANCLNGFFTGVQTQVCMAEEFLRLKDRGAVAVWAPSGLGYPAGHRVLLREFYDAIFQDDLYTLGAATMAAKIAASENSLWNELIETFVLFGDPATPLGIPTNYPYVESTTPVNGATDVPLDQEIQIVFSKPMSPTTVLLSGPGTAGLVLTPTWSAENTVLNYAHTGFDYNQTLTFTINGQDRLGNALGSRPVPSTWSFRTPFAPTDVPIGGPATGVVQVDYTFNATVTPINATPPFTYTWEATGQTPSTHVGGGLSDAVTFNWDTPGAKTITVTVSNDVGTATNTAEVMLDYSPPTGVQVTGPTKAAVDTAYAFSAAVGPVTATRPITYAWRATGQSPVTHTGGGFDDSVDFTWTTTGTKTITVTTTNAGGSFTQTHQVIVWSSSVDIAGPTAGVVQTDYTFTATVNPSTSPQPITYTWEATGQTPLTHAGQGLIDTAIFTWDTPGTKTIDVTATNADGTLTNTYEVSISYAPPTHVEVTGPMTGTVDTACTFHAAVSPITATQPITYVWQATGQPSVTHTGGELNDAVTFTWNTTGTKTISVTATNAGGAVRNNYLVTITEVSQRTVYLPLVIRND